MTFSHPISSVRYQNPSVCIINRQPKFTPWDLNVGLWYCCHYSTSQMDLRCYVEVRPNWCSLTPPLSRKPPQESSLSRVCYNSLCYRKGYSHKNTNKLIQKRMWTGDTNYVSIMDYLPIVIPIATAIAIGGFLKWKLCSLVVSNHRPITKTIIWLLSVSSSGQTVSARAIAHWPSPIHHQSIGYQRRSVAEPIEEGDSKCHDWCNSFDWE